MVNNGYVYDDALRSTFELTPEELLQKVKDYIRSETLPYSTMKPDDIATVHSHHIRSLEKDEAQQAIQELLSLVETLRNANL